MLPAVALPPPAPRAGRSLDHHAGRGAGARGAGAHREPRAALRRGARVRRRGRQRRAHRRAVPARRRASRAWTRWCSRTTTATTPAAPRACSQHLEVDRLLHSLPAGASAARAGRGAAALRGAAWPGSGTACASTCCIPASAAARRDEAQRRELRAARDARPARSMLLTGDIEQRRGSGAGRARRGSARAPTSLLVPHHGSRTSSYARCSSPRCARVSRSPPVGYRNRFGHPHAEVLERYAAAGIGRPAHRPRRRGDGAARDRRRSRSGRSGAPRALLARPACLGP